MLMKGDTQGLVLQGGAGTAGTVRFVESSDDPWRNGYRILSPSEFITMKASLVGQTAERTSPTLCPGCEMDAAQKTSPSA